MASRFLTELYKLMEAQTDPMGAIKPGEGEISLTKEVEVPSEDTVTTTQKTHIAQQKERLSGELKSGMDAVRQHFDAGNLKLARLALESLEALEEELRALELEEASLTDKLANKKAE